MESTDIFDHQNVFGIVGASTDQTKYGNKVLRDLKDAGYCVVPINPKASEVEGLKAYPSLSDSEADIDVAVFVVPPSVTLEALKHMPKSIKAVWMQPGASDEACIRYCEDKDIACMHDACVMLRKPEAKND